jgi:two-component system LytT family sensor kinase
MTGPATTSLDDAMIRAATRPSPDRDVWRSPRLWAVAAAVVTVFGLLNATQTYVRIVLRGRDSFTWALALAGDLPFWAATLATFPIVVWAVHRFPLLSSAWKRAALIHVGMSLAHAALKLLLGLLVAHPLVNALGDRISLVEGAQQVFVASYAGSVSMYWALVGVVLAVDYYNETRERERRAAQAEVRAAQLETHLERARLDWLRSQLNPHFLFNTLNSVSTLARQGRTSAVVKTLADLADLLRTTLSHSGVSVPLEQELRLLDRYLDIERLRFGDRLSVEVDASDDARRAPVPSLLLQPIVENALRHGVGRIRGPVQVRIRARRTDAGLELTVTDSGRGFEPDWSEGVGLSSTRARLRQLYGEAASLDVASSDAGARVSITLPYEVGAKRPSRTGPPVAVDVRPPGVT